MVHNARHQQLFRLRWIIKITELLFKKKLLTFVHKFLFFMKNNAYFHTLAQSLSVLPETNLFGLHSTQTNEMVGFHNWNENKSRKYWNKMLWLNSKSAFRFINFIERKKIRAKTFNLGIDEKYFILFFPIECFFFCAR